MIRLLQQAGQQCGIRSLERKLIGPAPTRGKRLPGASMLASYPCEFRLP
jgi:hypothetical protein